MNHLNTTCLRYLLVSILWNGSDGNWVDDWDFFLLGWNVVQVPWEEEKEEEEKQHTCQQEQKQPCSPQK